MTTKLNCPNCGQEIERSPQNIPGSITSGKWECSCGETYTPLYQGVYLKQLERDKQNLIDLMASSSLNAILQTIQQLQDEIQRLKDELAELKAGQRWIPVDERLPEAIDIKENCFAMSSPVMVTNGGIIDIMVYDHFSATWYRPFGQTYTLFPTHWQPLPEPPKDK